MSKILLLEDDVSLVDGLRYSLKKSGYDVTVVRTVEEAISNLPNLCQYDLLLLDVTLPDGTGFEVCERVREHDKQIPIIFLTASDEEVCIIRGLDLGGMTILPNHSCWGVQLRRSGKHEQDKAAVIQCGDITIDLLSSRALLNGKALELTAAEYRLLCLLVKNEGLVMTREKIFEALWDSSGDFVDDNTLSVYVRRLREKIEKNPSRPEHLITVRGFGYQWKEVLP